MKKQAIAALRYAVGLGIGAVLLYFAFKDVKFEEISSTLANANYIWIAAALVVSLASHWLRGYRWKMLLAAAGYEPRSSMNTFAAVMVGYMANTAVPRLGEITRCTVLTRSDGVPFLTGAGTVVTERTLDVLTLGLFILSILTLEFQTIIGYFQMAIAARGGLNFSLYFAMGGVALLGLGFLWFYRNAILRLPFAQKIWKALENLINALLSVRYIKKPGVFFASTLGIWFCYVLTTYLVFRALGNTYNFYFAYIVTIMGGIGMALPAPGGLGPFHTAVIYTFTLFGYSENDGRLIALLIHTPQLVLNIVAGAIGYFYLILQKPKEVSE